MVEHFEVVMQAKESTHMESSHEGMGLRMRIWTYRQPVIPITEEFSSKQGLFSILAS
jgi:hypothetical protein